MATEHTSENANVAGTPQGIVHFFRYERHNPYKTKITVLHLFQLNFES